MKLESPSHKKIIEVLDDGKVHHKDEFPVAYNGLRGRVSELNRWGYVIRRVDEYGYAKWGGDYFKLITIPIRESINEIVSVNLKPVNDKIQIIPIGDLHYGNPCFTEKSEEKLDGYINWVLNNKGAYCIMMGDLIESANPHSPFQIRVTPQEQYEWILQKFAPLAEAKKILAILSGNHENWIFTDKGFDVVKTMSLSMKVPYLGDSGYIGMKVGKQFYTAYVMHPHTAVTKKSSKIKMLEDLGSIHNVDMILCAHIHSIITEEQMTRNPNFATGNVENKKQLIVGTGSFLEYGDYAERARYKPEKMGAPKIILSSNKFDMHLSK